MFKIRFTPQAIADLEAIKRYISDDLFNPQAAADLVALVFEKIRTLASLPQTGARLRTDLPVFRTYRFIQCKNYLVFYRTEEKFVSIIRILYARRDYFGLLEMDPKIHKDV
ncbi:MAG: type II toxin-antitoxin system RelE/ParE family toxin [Terrimicrobiaceae bacterium]